MISGLLLVLLALWGGLIPFIGPYFDFGFGSSDAWVYTTDRLVLSILPAIAVGVGGLILMAAANRPVAMFGGWLAALGGLWFIVGNTIGALFNTSMGQALGGEARQVTEQLSFFEGLGAIMVLLSALALGRFLVVGVREARQEEREQRPAVDDRAGPEFTAVPAQQRRRSHFHLGRQKQKSGASAGSGREETPPRRE